VKAHFRGRLADTELSRDRLVRQVVHVPENDHHPHLARQVLERADEQLPVVNGSCSRFGVALGPHLENLELVVELEVRGSSAFGNQRRGAVHGDAMQPSAERGVAAELAQRAERSQVGLLEHVARIVLVADEAEGQRVALGRRGTHELLERCPITIARKRDLCGEVVDLDAQRVSL